jgi:hypothetical protein
VAKNYYFENYENSMEQNLIEDLVIESIKIFGVDCYYIPRYRIPDERNVIKRTAAADILIDDPSGSVFSITLTEPGLGYPSEPIVTISDPVSGTTATAIARIVRGVVTEVQINNAGTGYLQADNPTVTIESPQDVADRLGIVLIEGGGYDDLLNENDLPLYKDALEIEMYVKNVDGFEGEGDFLSKFGLQIRDSMTLTVAIRSWNIDVATNLENNPSRPYEGDLIYFPLNKKIFKIMHVEHEAIFYQMGSLQTYDLRCELFEYSNERFQTGIPEVDSVFVPYNIASSSGEDVLTNEQLQNTDNFADNFTIETEADNILDFTAENPFGENNF